MKKSTVLVVAVSTLAVLAPSAFAAISVTTEAAAFTTDFTGAAAEIGAAMIGAAFVAVVYKWIKATIFG
jgi:hypothetical protein